MVPRLPLEIEVVSRVSHRGFRLMSRMETAEKRAAKTEGNSEPAYSFSGVVGGWHALILSAQGLSRPRSLKLTAPLCYPCDIRDWRRIRMALYLVSYDIKEKNDDYQSLWTRLETLKAERILYSEWFVAHPDAGMAKSLADDLLQHITDGDRLLVQEVGADAAWTALRIDDTKMNGWLANVRR
jgi:hypothetical protein